MVLGEPACGNCRDAPKPNACSAVCQAVLQAPDHLVLRSIDSHRLFGKGIGWIDAHLFTGFPALCSSPLDPRPAISKNLAGGAPFY